MRERSVVLLVFMMILSFCSFLVLWVYNLNKRFENFDSDKAPDSARGLVIMFLMPVFWVILMYILKLFLLSSFLPILKFVDMVVWSFIIFLALQYLYDFCICFGDFTMTNGVVWYVFLWIGFFPLILLPFGSFYFTPILIFPIVTIPLMQKTLNKNIDRFERGVSGSKFYTRNGKKD